MEEFDVIVLGAGAAGMMCAVEAGRRGRRVLLLEHRQSPGEKIRISGGGRCNFTNLEIAPDRYISANPHFARSALARYTQWDFIDWVSRTGISWHEKTLGQLFCDRSAKDIIALLTDAMQAAGVQMRLGVAVEGVAQGNRWKVTTDKGSFCAASVVVATGGKSVPKIGATGIGYDIARSLGIAVLETRPGLVPLTFTGPILDQARSMAGTSVDARVSGGGAAFREGLLFTHRGLSGPSILQISSYWAEGDEIEIDLLPAADVVEKIEAIRKGHGGRLLSNGLSAELPKALAQEIAQDIAPAGRLADLSKPQMQALAQRVHHWRIRPAGSEGYRTAEVTLGGVDTDALDARTMEAKAHPGLYFIGEVVDVTGWLGGYNFQWAWSSGWAAGQVA